jgi:hypothetical protein
MNNIMKKLSYESLLIVILVCVSFTYLVVMLDDKKYKIKETFSSVDGSVLELENFENGKSTSATPTTTSTPTSTPIPTKTQTTSQTTTTNTIVDPNADGSGDAGSNMDAITEDSSQDIVQTPDKKTTIVHNHYYGGNKEIAKFLGALAEQQEKDLNKEQSNLIDQGMCSELNNKLGNKTLAEIKNDRLLFDLKTKCDNQVTNQNTCKVAPTQGQTALLGTLLDDAKNTQFGSIVAR